MTAEGGPTLRQRLEAGLLLVSGAFVQAMPRAWMIALASAFGQTAGLLARDRLRVARENVAATLGREWSARDQRRLARRSMGHAAALAVDFGTLPTVAKDPPRWCEIPESSRRVLLEAQARGRGVLLVASHFGWMESMGIALGHAGFPVAFVAKPFANPLVDAIFARWRGLTGNTTIHKGGAKERILSTLAAGGRVAIVIDQHAGPHDRAWIPLLGIPAATSRSAGTIALESGAPIVPIHAFPMSGARLRCEFGPIIEPVGDAESILRETMAVMEQALRRAPEAWLWLHRRWNVHPDGRGEGYPAYSISESEEARRKAARAERAALRSSARTAR
jgi:KDO2-lipid IV(A) lauroyltransferase